MTGAEAKRRPANEESAAGIMPTLAPVAALAPADRLWSKTPGRRVILTAKSN